jgi:(S)-2-hydroxyglutarate dehydrogenase
MRSASYDDVIIGAGIVGLTVARELKERAPSARIAILDKENTVGVHLLR